MALPKFNEMYIPALEMIKSKGEVKTAEMRQLLKVYYSLNDEEYLETSAKGNNIFYGRLSWCLSDLYRSGLISKPQNGIYSLTDLGEKMLTTPDDVEEYVLKKVRSLDALRKYKQGVPAANDSSIEPTSSDSTPEERLEQAYQEIRDKILGEILDTIMRKKPSEFERITLHLLKKMGYGGALGGTHIQTKLSGDGGIDGVIKEDILGLDYIYIQAKRYKEGNNVGREDIQKFVGALSVAQSKKGVFITTSDFTSEAKDYATKLTGQSIVLINGMQLSEYIYEYGLGMQQEMLLEIKKIDQDFWGNYDDEQPQIK